MESEPENNYFTASLTFDPHEVISSLWLLSPPPTLFPILPPPPLPPPTSRPTMAAPIKHVMKPKPLTDAKDLEKFRRQAFNITEYALEFTQEEMGIHFLLSSFTGGLQEKFMANFIDSIIGQPNPN